MIHERKFARSRTVERDEKCGLVLNQLLPNPWITAGMCRAEVRYSKGKIEMHAGAYIFAAMALLMSIALAKGDPAARGDCEAFGRVYRDGQSFRLSTGEYGDPRIYICNHGTWNEYDGNLWQFRRPAR